MLSPEEKISTVILNAQIYSPTQLGEERTRVRYAVI
jgi:hypothetical protein